MTDFTRAGRPTFTIDRAVSPRLPFVAQVVCICCGASFAVPYGSPVATFRVSSEILGLSCDGCLDPDSRARLLSMRRQSEVRND